MGRSSRRLTAAWKTNDGLVRADLDLGRAADVARDEDDALAARGHGSLELGKVRHRRRGAARSSGSSANHSFSIKAHSQISQVKTRLTLHSACRIQCCTDRCKKLSSPDQESARQPQRLRERGKGDQKTS